MFDLLQNILDLLVSFFSAIGDLLFDLFDVIRKVNIAVRYLPNLFSWLPDAVTPILIATFGVVIVYKVLGREG